MRFPVFLRGLGDPWSQSQTADVSASGAFFVTERPFLLNTPIEYVLTFPTELTKAPQPLRVRFFGSVLRCERIADGSGSFGVAVRNAAHRYLTPQESATFDAMEHPSGSSAATVGSASLR
jgi:PilZ domain